jgi:hypothetical protein
MDLNFFAKLIAAARQYDLIGRYADASQLDNILHRFAQTVQEGEEEFNNTYDIPEENLAAVQAKIDKYNKKIASINDRKAMGAEKLTPITYDILNRFTRKVQKSMGGDDFDFFGGFGGFGGNGRNNDFFEEVVPYVKIQINGDAPRIKGWTFIARILHGQDDKGQPMNTFLLSPGKEIPEQYKNAGPRCEHCNSNRKRLDTFILQNAEGRYIQVGSSCLTEFLNSNDIGSIIFYLNALSDLESSMGEMPDSTGGGYKSYYSTAQTLNLITAITRLFGYTSLRRAEESRGIIATKDLLLTVLNPPQKDVKEWYERYRKWLEPLAGLNIQDKQAIKDFTEKAVEYVKSLKDKENPSDFEWNLSASMFDALNKGYIDPKRIGIVAYFAAAYQKFLDKNEPINERSPENKRALSLDEIKAQYPAGAKITADVTLLKVQNIESMYGVSALHIFKDENNTMFKWFSSGGKELGEPGDQFDIAGTVKQIDVYQGTPFVQLLRVKSKKAAEIQTTRQQQSETIEKLRNHILNLINNMEEAIDQIKRQQPEKYPYLTQANVWNWNTNEWKAFIMEHPEIAEINAMGQDFLASVAQMEQYIPSFDLPRF